MSRARLMPITQAAQLIGVAYHTLQHYVTRAGTLDATKVGERWFLTEQQFAEAREFFASKGKPQPVESSQMSLTSVGEFAAKNKISPAAMRTAIRQGLLEVVNAGGRWYLTPDQQGAALEYFATQARQAQAQVISLGFGEVAQVAIDNSTNDRLDTILARLEALTEVVGMLVDAQGGKK